MKALEATFENACSALIDQQTDGGYWLGELSSSALSTATAVQALNLADREGNKKFIDAGLRWLVRNQNPDGGWGDTVKSYSNLSTTLLVWSALNCADGLPGDNKRILKSERLAESWITDYVGSLEPARIAEAAAARYGKDRTFSAPILMMCAIAGRLGSGAVAWRHVAALPFELSVLPRSLFGALRLPVVSYALPALIAIGYCRFRNLPPLSPFRFIRKKLWPRASRVLEEIQPVNGGFLEATPLTSFVTMALAASGEKDHPVVSKAVGFLRESVAKDGSWKIDTNLSTWLTTMSVKALASASQNAGSNLIPKAGKISKWLLNQQYREVHPYTNTPPGGWAWTDLPGGVPDADDTSGALIALSIIGRNDPAAKYLESAEEGILWLLNLQNNDGGIPTFCKGWGALPFDKSSPDITAHCIRSWDKWHDHIDPVIAARVEISTERAISYLKKNQEFDGSWAPLWFGNQYLKEESNLTYGTSQVIVALAEISPRYGSMAEHLIRDGIQWLEAAQNNDGGWGGGLCSGHSSIEETALAVDALLCAGGNREIANDGVQWLIHATSKGRKFPAAPIGFYFAKLWYHEALYPLIWSVSALRRAYNLGK